MQILNVELTKVRSFEHSTFVFKPGMNILVGINGVGKSTILEATRISLSKIMHFITAAYMQQTHQTFTDEDINVNSKSLEVKTSIYLNGKKHIITTNKNYGNADVNFYSTKFRELSEQFKISREQPIVLFFSTRRSLVTYSSDKLLKGKTSSNQEFAYSQALSPARELQISVIAHWMRAQVELSKEFPIAKRHLKSLENAIRTFLPECSKLRPVTTPRLSLVVNKGNTKLDIGQLSDGERGLFAIVLDIAKRLSQANPDLDDPIKDGKGIVLIDEIDLHLHPKWQRGIVEQLRNTFPNIQFILTTHSPFIVQSARQGDLLKLDGNLQIEPFGRSLEEVTRLVMDVTNTDRSLRYQQMLDTARGYLKLVDEARSAKTQRRNAIQKQLIKMLVPFTDNPAYTALLERRGTIKTKE